MKQINKIQKKKEQKLSVKKWPREAASHKNRMSLEIIKDIIRHSRIETTINFIQALSREQGRIDFKR